MIEQYISTISFIIGGDNYAGLALCKEFARICIRNERLAKSKAFQYSLIIYTLNLAI